MDSFLTKPPLEALFQQAAGTRGRWARIPSHPAPSWPTPSEGQVATNLGINESVRTLTSFRRASPATAQEQGERAGSAATCALHGRGGCGHRQIGGSSGSSSAAASIDHPCTPTGPAPHRLAPGGGVLLHLFLRSRFCSPAPVGNKQAAAEADMPRRRVNKQKARLPRVLRSRPLPPAGASWPARSRGVEPRDPRCLPLFLPFRFCGPSCPASFCFCGVSARARPTPRR